MNSKLKTVGLILVVALITVGVVYAVSYFMTSNPVTGTVTPQATLSLALSPSTVTLGDSWTLTATVSDGTGGITVTFLEGASTVGTANTDVSGVASITFAPTVGSHTYTATATHP